MAKPKSDAPKKPRKPRQPKAEPVAAQATFSASSEAVLKKPSADQVKTLVKRLAKAKAEQDSINGSAREMIAKAVETQHFDKTALSMVRRLYKMAKDRPEALAVTLPHLLSYIDDLGIAEVADDNAGLPLETADGGEAGGDFSETPDEQPFTGKSMSLSIVPRPDEDNVAKVGRGVA